MKKYYFIAGLHRSGATLLSSILNQNPRFYSGPLTPVLDIMKNIESNIPTIEHYKSSPKPISAHKIISSVIGEVFFHNKFLLFNFFKFSLITATLAICSGCPGPVS